MHDGSGRVAVLAPVRLQEDTVDLLEVDGLGTVSDGLEQGSETEVSQASEHAIGRAHEARERVGGEVGMREPASGDAGVEAEVREDSSLDPAADDRNLHALARCRLPVREWAWQEPTVLSTDSVRGGVVWRTRGARRSTTPCGT